MTPQKKTTASTFHLVICDDDVDDQFLLKKAIEHTGLKCEITCVDNGLQLMELLLKNENETRPSTPDLVFLDLNMPLLNGFGVLQQMREKQMLDKIPVYVFSTSNLADDKRRSISLGARDFITKPHDFELFKQAIDDICGRHA
jgi:two-component system response regulator